MRNERNELIVVRQLPIIEEQLRQIKQEIETQVAAALQLACTEATVKEVKKVRAELGKGFQDLENRRKEVKKVILAPYEAFEAVYKDCVTDVFKPADDQLKAKIAEVENGIKEQKQAEVEAYFREYRDSKDIDFVEFDRTGITVTLTASKKSLKEQAKAFIDKIVEEMDLISIQERREEILVEYKQSLNVAQAITKVNNRHIAIEEERAKAEAARQIAEQKKAAAQKVEAAMPAPEVAPPSAITPPAAIPAETADSDAAERIYRVRYQISGTYDMMVALKRFLVEGGYDYVKLES